MDKCFECGRIYGEVPLESELSRLRRDSEALGRVVAEIKKWEGTMSEGCMYRIKAAIADAGEEQSDTDDIQCEVCGGHVDIDGPHGWDKINQYYFCEECVVPGEDGEEQS